MLCEAALHFTVEFDLGRKLQFGREPYAVACFLVIQPILKVVFWLMIINPLQLK